ncbi:hypothetical protein BDV29DRAFT_161354 [Aspergillus leporis]|uniref:DNA2/NAM7 helicase-like C-terminal domain-containing protein n=1 Tax=Aspergillus leporis TaxID=41062 RepID=A0A5N5WP05_9EURO|nr:hypothetical protein BDV29DRAFT_161354 [Aspergillus leporis]
MVLEFLEFEHQDSHEAFSSFEQPEGMALVGGKGKEVDAYYLYDRWANGKQHRLRNSHHLNEEACLAWAMDRATRNSHTRQWKQTLVEEQVAKVQSLMLMLDNCQARLEKLWNEKRQTIIRSKFIIGYTTTAAAEYTAEVSAASPGILLLEEVGEILESRVLAAMGPQTKQLVLIGDHLQLRQKTSNYALSVEKGGGYDLNRSLFERLVLSGYPRSTLAKQHRMCPEISTLVRNLTYPELLDDPKMLNHPRPHGLQDPVTFIDHTHPEMAFSQVSGRRAKDRRGASEMSSRPK